MKYIKFLKDLNKNDLLIGGGKGANLGAMINAGFQVPDGFCITTNAYNQFIVKNKIFDKITKIIINTKTNDISSLENTSSEIKNIFKTGILPDDINTEILNAFNELKIISGYNKLSVAVRSSATAEDLPELSFAGQQDTYLNINSSHELLKSIINCWASLWTARAIGYRERNHISHNDISLAVIIQQMVQSTTSGVMFTANPLTGKRTEIVIDATIGLGEALVSGIVEQDHYVIDALNLKIINKTIGKKEISIRSLNEGGTIKVKEDAKELQCLNDEDIIKLAKIGLCISEYFKFPQDIEWAIDHDNIHIVQSRPITTLHPLPENSEYINHNYNLKVWLSFASWQVMMDPFTPLGQDMIKCFGISLANKIGFKTDLKNQNIFEIAGERIYFNITQLFHFSFLRNKIPLIISNIEPAACKPLENLLNDNRLKPTKLKIKIIKIIKILLFIIKLLINSIRNLINPQKGRIRIYKILEKIINKLKFQIGSVTSLNDLLIIINKYLIKLPALLLPKFIPCIMTGQIAFQNIKTTIKKFSIDENYIIDLTRGLSYNVTTEMDLELYMISKKIKNDRVSLEYFNNSVPIQIANDFMNNNLPELSQSAINDFMKKYGMRGIGEIDIGRKRWKEDPLYIMQIVKNYLLIKNDSKSPEFIFEKSRNIAKSAEEKILNSLKQSKKGSKKINRIKFMINRYRKFGGMRELPKFLFIKLFGIYRDKILELGKMYASNGKINGHDDLFFLHIDELQIFDKKSSDEWKKIIVQRRTVYEKEKKRKNIPRLLLSDGTAYYEGVYNDQSEEKNIISGSPVSGGVVEGTIRVVSNPLEANLNQGEIMVCQATDPAWTPLFLTAGGLIMEVGGMMTHGSVVAREYGIPAIVGIAQATNIFKTGQKVKLDGSSGKIYILEQ